MSKQTMRKWGIGVGLAAVVVLASGSRWSPLQCELAWAWVMANKDNLPQTFAEIGKYAPAYRRAIYSQLPDSTRAAQWRAHLDRFLKPSAGLTNEQRAFLRGTQSQLDAVFQLSLPERQAEIAHRRALADSLFAPPMARLIFTYRGWGRGELAPVVAGTPKYSLATAARTFSVSRFDVRRLMQLGQRLTRGTIWCDCRVESASMDCEEGMGICQDEGECIVPIQGTGCGMFGEHQCLGICT